ncbi:MAG: FG-GAP repeat protein [Myxococcota bacterium]|nr:FG-GAP repeat protein [Myxococcota bacterium]
MPQSVLAFGARIAGRSGSTRSRWLGRSVAAGWLVASSLAVLLPTSAFGGSEDAEWLGSSPTTADEFGGAVGVSSAAAGTVAVVGASLEDDAPLVNNGAVYVFRNDGMNWALEQRLTPAGAEANDEFGGAVAVEGDVMVVGADLDDTVEVDSGSAYVFRYNGLTWDEEQTLAAFSGATGDQFGFSVSVSGDLIAVGAVRDDVSAVDSGSTYVFRDSGMGWIQEQRLLPDDPAASDEFGGAVAVSGTTVVVGADLDDALGTDSGSAYVFIYTGSPSTPWLQEQKLTASDGAAGDLFGFSVAISGDTIIVGAHKKDVDGKVDAGKAYVYRFNGLAWVEEAKLTESTPNSENQFGVAVAISGNRAVIGADDDAEITGGFAYLFRRTGSTWAEEEVFAGSDIPTGVGPPHDAFGNSVSITSDSAVVGAPTHVHSVISSGSAYVFSVPEPSAALVAATALLTLAAARRRSA